MNQILMAAARGARIELRHFNEQCWYRAYSIDVNGGSAAIDGTYRIHPDDEHLRFGPISTALRKHAENAPKYIGEVGYPLWGHLATELGGYITGGSRNSRMYYEHVDELHRSLFLLILSEALSDQGL